MQFLSTVLNIIIFLLCLSVLVCLHEAGHLAVAKICNVYCFEYSIGFGPLLFKHKFKHKKKAKDGEVFSADEKEEGETQFSIRALPLGGYVAMAGEETNIAEDGTVIPPERCLNNVNHFKQICIMLAGIAMNFLLALVLFFFSNISPQTRYLNNVNAVTVEKDSEAYKSGLQTGDKITHIYQVYNNIYNKDGEKIESLTFPISLEQGKMTSYLKTKNGSSTYSTYNEISTDSIAYAAMDFFTAVRNGNYVIEENSFYKNWTGYYIGPDSTRTFYVDYERTVDGKVTTDSLCSNPIASAEQKEKVKGDDGKEYTVYSMGLFGISASTETYNYDFGTAVVKSGSDFSRLFTGIYKALGSLFTPDGWKQMGGIISVYNMSASGVSSGSISYFLMLWGYISLNLGCFNLLPFPGLDGWQTLMAIIESIIRRKVPPKVKNVANTIGLLLMFLLAGLLVVKDIIFML